MRISGIFDWFVCVCVIKKITKNNVHINCVIYIMLNAQFVMGKHTEAQYNSSRLLAATVTANCWVSIESTERRIMKNAFSHYYQEFILQFMRPSNIRVHTIRTEFPEIAGYIPHLKKKRTISSRFSLLLLFFFLDFFCHRLHKCVQCKKKMSNQWVPTCKT